MTPTALLVATLYHHLTTLQGALEDAGWSVEAFDDPREALERLRGAPFQAVFCDAYLRGASPAGLLAWSRRLASDLPFYVVALDPSTVRLAGPHEPDAVLRFPPDPAALPSPGTHTRRFEPSEAGVPLVGDLASLPLGSLVDMLGLAHQSAIVAVDGDPGGRVVIEGGTLRQASCGPHRGLRALAELLRLRRGAFRVEPFQAPKRRDLNVPVPAALTEAAKLLEEIEHDRSLIEAARSACPSATGLATGYPLSGAPRFGVGDAQQAFDAGCRLLEANRGAVAKLTHLCVEGELGALAIVLYGDGNLLAAVGPSGQSLRLLAGLARAARAPTAP